MQAINTNNKQKYKMNFILNIKLPKPVTEKRCIPVQINKKNWGFLELFETTMEKDLHTGNPWLDVKAWDELQSKVKSRKKQVRFILQPTIYIIPRQSEEEIQQEQNQRWESMLQSLKIDQ